jgi:uncharacterized membrane protein
MTRVIWTLVVMTSVFAAGEAAWAAEAEPWVGRLLGRLHPLVVHFPIALLVTAASVEAVNLLRGRPIAGEVVFTCLGLGAAGAVVAAILGWQAGAHADFTGRAAEMLDTHYWLGIGSAVGSVVALGLCVAERRESSPVLRRAYLTGLMGCGVVVGVAGHYGGMLVFGDDHLTSAVPFLRAAPISLASVEPVGTTDFERDVLPIFESSCFSCHGPKKQNGDLRLDARHLSIEGGKSGLAVLPGDGEQSTVVRRLLGLDNEKRMPQNEDPLPAQQIAIIKAWIDQGADWPDNATVADASIEKHWAYVKPTRPRRPAVQNSKWLRNPLDAFVLARLEREGLQPSPEADRITLIRRLYFDLIGLPPNPKQVDAFVNDTAPNAYAVVVERLLASPRYGERWAVPWLDAARYGDSNGYQRDEARSAWPYRDWVIKALNIDMPFDQFTIEQIAGDLLPDPTLEQLIATGFHRGSPANLEGGADPEEYRVAQILDRTNVTGTVWLGTTIECAQCHKHPYDPFTHREYYQLFSFFNNTPIETEYMEGAVGVRFVGPFLSVPFDESATSTGTADTLVMTELAEPRETHLLKSGSFLNPGERVEAETPSALHPMPPTAERNRLGLARWLVSPENPLTARVTVNRWWSEFFGRGLVETVEDFGANGEPPSHPELLDWLAVEFVERGWSMKGIHRLIVKSATYRQKSAVNAELLERDPQNRLFARGSRLRLPAEMIRDNALVISGRFNGKLYGPPVYPDQPEGLWEKAAGALTDDENKHYPRSKGVDGYRRSIYTFWRRTVLYPSFATFDAPSRLATCVQRQRSNSPLQALTLMNDPVYADLARVLAGRILRAPKAKTLTDRIEYAFRLAVARKPDPEETKLLSDLYTRELERNRNDPTEARKLANSFKIPATARVNQWAAWYYVASTLLNLDETITKG